MLIVAAGSLLASGLFCLWISLQSLSELDGEQAQRRAPQPEKSEDPQQKQPQLTRLGRPIEEVRLGA